MPAPQVVILNGASGSGKTSTAENLVKRLENATWIHPDGLWDTPTMEAEQILKLATERIQHPSDISIIDCQIRPTLIAPILEYAGISSWLPVLHHCPRELRESRLLARNWTASAFPQIANWANILFEEANALGHLTVDTSSESSDQICATILHTLSEISR